VSYLYGLDGNDTLYGGTWMDYLDGGNGNDLLVVADGYDTLDGGAGTDTASFTNATEAVQANVDDFISIENLTGSNYNDVLTGNAGANSLSGGTGNDVLTGGAGNDSLAGGRGTDVFRFDSAPAAINVDRISDYVVLDDTIQLENAVFAKLTVTGTLAAGNFVSNINGTAADANDYIIYESDTGILRYDADGNGVGAAVQFAVIGINLAMTAAEFVVT
jgi:Ca2+-binding RTX toxin-like protein